MVRASVPKRIRSHDVAAVIAQRLLLLEESLNEATAIDHLDDGSVDLAIDAAEQAVQVATYELTRVAELCGLDGAVNRILDAAAACKAGSSS